MLIETSPGRRINVSDSMLIAASNLTVAYTSLLAQREGRESKYPSEIDTETVSSFIGYLAFLHQIVQQ